MEQTFIIGVGSHFGDDQLGWRVAEILATQTHPGVSIRNVASPDALLHLHGGADHWVIVDAGVDHDRTGSILRLEWPSDNIIPSTLPRGTHDLGLVASLKLVEALGDLPRRVTLWVGVVREDGTPTAMSAEGEQLAFEIAHRIRGELLLPLAAVPERDECTKLH
jgi:hydrogenase maturation protease